MASHKLFATLTFLGVVLASIVGQPMGEFDPYFAEAVTFWGNNNCSFPSPDLYTTETSVLKGCEKPRFLQLQNVCRDLFKMSKTFCSFPSFLQESLRSGIIRQTMKDPNLQTGQSLCTVVSKFSEVHKLYLKQLANKATCLLVCNDEIERERSFFSVCQLEVATICLMTKDKKCPSLESGDITTPLPTLKSLSKTNDGDNPQVLSKAKKNPDDASSRGTVGVTASPVGGTTTRISPAQTNGSAPTDMSTGTTHSPLQTETKSDGSEKEGSKTVPNNSKGFKVTTNTLPTIVKTNLPGLSGNVTRVVDKTALTTPQPKDEQEAKVSPPNTSGQINVTNTVTVSTESTLQTTSRPTMPVDLEKNGTSPPKGLSGLGITTGQGIGGGEDQVNDNTTNNNKDGGSDDIKGKNKDDESDNKGGSDSTISDNKGGSDSIISVNKGAGSNNSGGISGENSNMILGRGDFGAGQKGSVSYVHPGADKSNQLLTVTNTGPEAPGPGHFFAYFLTAVVLCVSGYVIFHNKQKIFAFIVEGRSARGDSRRRSGGAKYTQLTSNVEEVMPSLETAASSKNFVY